MRTNVLNSPPDCDRNTIPDYNRNAMGWKKGKLKNFQCQAWP